MDDAFCGGGDTNEGLYNTAIPIQGSAVSMIKAAIFMGDPRYIYGLSYEVGTCKAAGVSRCPNLIRFLNFFFFWRIPLTRHSSLLAQPVSNAPLLPRSAPTATPQIHIAVTATTPPRTKATETSMDRQLWRS
jgi:hypothetical protein